MNTRLSEFHTPVRPIASAIGIRSTAQEPCSFVIIGLGIWNAMGADLRFSCLLIASSGRFPGEPHRRQQKEWDDGHEIGSESGKVVNLEIRHRFVPEHRR